MLAKALVLVLAFVIVPGSARAATLYDIVALSNSGVPDAILIALIDVDGTPFTLSPLQIIELREAGVSDAVIVRMIERVQPTIETLSAPEPTVVTIAVPYFVPVPVDTRRTRPRVGGHSKDRNEDRKDEGYHNGHHGRGAIAAGLSIRGGEFVR